MPVAPPRVLLQHRPLQQPRVCLGLDGCVVYKLSTNITQRTNVKIDQTHQQINTPKPVDPAQHAPKNAPLRMPRPSPGAPDSRASLATARNSSVVGPGAIRRSVLCVCVLNVRGCRTGIRRSVDPSTHHHQSRNRTAPQNNETTYPPQPPPPARAGPRPRRRGGGGRGSGARGR